MMTLSACGGTSPVAPQAAGPDTQSAVVFTPLLAPSPTPAPPAPLPSSNPLVGSYAMTIELARSCSVPEEAWLRQYAASIAERGPDLLVTLGAATFLEGPICTAGPGRAAGVRCNQFFASSDSGTAHFALENHNDDAHGSHIVERLPSGTWVEIIGDASGAFTPGSSTITAQGRASVWYCPQAAGYPFPCSNPTGCQAEMEIRLTRN